MDVVGEIGPDRPVLVVALEQEAAAMRGLGPGLLVTGPGKVRAAIATAALLARARPLEVVNLGTAGALRDGVEGIQVIGRVVQHDFDDAVLQQLTGQNYEAPIELGDGPTLATGDRFVADEATRARLAEHAEVVDMEGYAVAAAARAAGVPVRLVKQISDHGDENATESWSATVAIQAQRLAAWVRDELLA